jgi:hypothetical protein
LSSFRTKTYTAAQLDVTDAIKASAATAVATSAFTDGDLIMSTLDLPRSTTITRSLSTGAYTLDPFTITGRRGGRTAVELITPANADGGDTLSGLLIFDGIANIDVPGQVSTAGALSFGVQDIGAPQGDAFSGIELHADGDLSIVYGQGSGAPTDVIPVVIANRAFYELAATRVVTKGAATAAATGDTTVATTVYLDC